MGLHRGRVVLPEIAEDGHRGGRVVVGRVDGGEERFLRFWIGAQEFEERSSVVTEARFENLAVPGLEVGRERLADVLVLALREWLVGECTCRSQHEVEKKPVRIIGRLWRGLLIQGWCHRNEGNQAKRQHHESRQSEGHNRPVHAKRRHQEIILQASAEADRPVFSWPQQTQTLTFGEASWLEPADWIRVVSQLLEPVARRDNSVPSWIN